MRNIATEFRFPILPRNQAGILRYILIDGQSIMKNILLVLCMNTMVMASSVLAKDPPVSAQQLRSQLESALKAKDKKCHPGALQRAGSLRGNEINGCGNV
jgi:hypothetical protein